MGRAPATPEHDLPVIVIGGSQAGLAASACLKRNGIRHLVFEKNRVAHSWRSQRWDSFCLVTPNWQCTLPGFAYAETFGGRDPDGFMVRDEIIRYIEAYRDHIDPPLKEGVGVRRVARQGDIFTVEADDGVYTASHVILATGGYHCPKIPDLAADLPDRVLQLHSSTYRNPDQTGDGGVLVIGSGQSGCQIAEDLHLAGKRVHLAVGSAPRAPRRYRGRDVTAWLVAMGHYELNVDDHPQGEAVRKKANHYMTGRDGGREIDLRRFALEGMQLQGRLRGIDGAVLSFGDDLALNLDKADATAERIKAEIDKWIEAEGVNAPKELPYRPVWSPPDGASKELDLDAQGIDTVIWSTGFAMDFGWLDLPALDTAGYPSHRRGVSSKVPNLYVLGLPWLWTWGSGRFSAVGDDAAYVTDRIAEALARTPT